MTTEQPKELTFDTLVSLCKRRGFVFPSSEIYGGIGGFWDYGPLGVEMKNNIKRAWWRAMVQERDDVVGIDASIIMNPKVWEASGHVATFTDPMVDCKNCKHRFRADHLEGDVCPDCGAKGQFTEARPFNLMFKTFVGPVEDTANEVYLRPETAQAMFVNFENVVTSMRRKLPFGIAQIGRSFRNEITPGNFIFRDREFEQMEMEFFCKPGTDDHWHEHWLEQRLNWFKNLGVREENLRIREHEQEELSHYSKAHLRHRVQLRRHGLVRARRHRQPHRLRPQGARQAQRQGASATSTKSRTSTSCPTSSSRRSASTAPSSSCSTTPTARKRCTRREARLPAAPPRDRADQGRRAAAIAQREAGAADEGGRTPSLRPHFMTQFDDAQSIGRRYRRQDEIGTPLCVTIDFDSLEDNAVTIRDRDTMEQTRVRIEDLVDALRHKLAGT